MKNGLNKKEVKKSRPDPAWMLIFDRVSNYFILPVVLYSLTFVCVLVGGLKVMVWLMEIDYPPVVEIVKYNGPDSIGFYAANIFFLF